MLCKTDLQKRYSTKVFSSYNLKQCEGCLLLQLLLLRRSNTETVIELSLRLCAHSESHGDCLVLPSHPQVAVLLRSDIFSLFSIFCNFIV